MSTNFDVYPGNSSIPTFSEVIELANRQINRYLMSIGIKTQVTISVKLQTIEGHKRLHLTHTDKIVWSEKNYAWFFFEKIAGGTDAYFYKNNLFESDIWEDELRVNPNTTKMQRVIKTCLSVGYHWKFRRSAGQPAIIVLAYGMLAASVAKLTNGFIYSDDGAWDYAMFPAKPDDFFKWYFNPNLTSDKNVRIFTKKCINSLKKMLIN
jgi:hypothetical protein